jgi:hypothetical protein
MAQTLGTLHYGGPWPYNSYTTNNASLPGGPSLADDFHVFSVEWEAQQVGCGRPPAAAKMRGGRGMAFIHLMPRSCPFT